MAKTTEKGFALMLVLFLVLVISGISMLLTQKFLFALRHEFYLKQRDQTLNVYEFYETTIQTNLENQLKALGLSRDFDMKRELIIPMMSSFGEIPVLIRNRSKCFNLNALFKMNQGKLEENLVQKSALIRLLLELKIERALVETFVDQLMDWVDGDDSVRAYGLEDYFYTGPQYQPKQYTAGRYLVHLSEIRALPIVEFLEWDLLSQYLCVIPDTVAKQGSETIHPMNINIFAEEDLPFLVALFPEFSMNDAKSAIMNIPPEGYQNMNTFKEINLRSENAAWPKELFKTQLFDVVLQFPFNKQWIELNTVYFIRYGSEYMRSSIKKVDQSFKIVDSQF